jgi:hypothetical protein
MLVYKIKTIPSIDTDLKSCLRLATIDVSINVVIQRDHRSALYSENKA